MHGCHEYTFSVTVDDDDGKPLTLQCCRVQEGRLESGDPYKGGVRFHPSVSVRHTRRMAQTMGRKCALHNLPFRGGKGGVAIDPSAWSDAVLERVCRAYVRALTSHELIGPHVDVPAPDVGTTARMMDWMADEYGNAGSFTGKTEFCGGSAGRTEATGYGVGLMTARAYADHLDPDLPKTFAIQGFGNVGRHAFQYLVQRGWTCVGAADHTGSFVGPVPSALGDEPCPRLASRVDAALRVDAETFLTTKATVLILAALEEQLTPGLCDRLQCALVVEGANSPCCDGADAALAVRGIPLLPDVLANGGGVIVSYYEWVQNQEGTKWRREEVLARLEERMLTTYDAVASDTLRGLRARCIVDSL